MYVSDSGKSQEKLHAATGDGSITGANLAATGIPANLAQGKTPVDWRARLRGAHMRVTPQRLAVLSTLQAHPHRSAGEIIALVNAGERENLTTQGTYVILQQLEQYGMVRRVSLPDSASERWETRVADNHHHVECVVCGRVEDVDCVIGHAPCLTPSDTHEMKVFEAQIVFRGLCNSCEAKIESGEIRREDLPYILREEHVMKTT